MRRPAPLPQWTCWSSIWPAGRRPSTSTALPPTYLKRHGTVRRLTGAALPAGLQEIQSLPAPIRFPLERDTFVLMVSDGVAGDGGDDWLQNTLAGWQGDDPQRLVSLLMGESRSRGGLKDDCSMLCLCAGSREKAV